MSTVRLLESLTSTQRRDIEAMTSRMRHRLEDVMLAPSEAKRREAGEWVLRIAAEIYAWSR